MSAQDEARARGMRRTLLHTHSMTNMAGRLMPEGECAACDRVRRLPWWPVPSTTEQESDRG